MPENWISEPDLRDLLGADAAKALAALGGRSIYVPRVPDAAHALARFAGPRAMEILCHAFGGERIALPSGRLGAHRHGIRKLLADGWTHAEIASRLKVTERYVRRIAGASSASASRKDPPEQLRLI